MNRRRRSVPAAMVAAGFWMVAGAAPAHAETPDEVFIEAVTSLGIEMAPDIDLPEVGGQVCDMLKKAVTGNPNPVPAIRGVVTTLVDNNLERDQAVGLMRTSVGVYCPQYQRFVGR